MESESIVSTPNKTFEPNEEQKKYIELVFNVDETIIDPEYNSTHICLSESEALIRAELVSDIEYTFSLALKKGDFYFG